MGENTSNGATATTSHRWAGTQRYPIDEAFCCLTHSPIARRRHQLTIDVKTTSIKVGAPHHHASAIDDSQLSVQEGIGYNHHLNADGECLLYKYRHQAIERPDIAPLREEDAHPHATPHRITKDREHTPRRK